MREETYARSAPWDNLVKSVTVFVIIFLISLILLFIVEIDDVRFIALLTILYASVLFIPYLWAPQGYFILKKTVIVKRLIGDVTISFIEEPKRWRWTWWGVRLVGSGGLYGYYGLFSFRGIGRVWMYATNRHNLILIKTDQGKKILLSPKDPEEFIKLAS